MGTLYDQPRRDWRNVQSVVLDGELASHIALAKKHRVELADVIALHAALEQKRSTDVHVSDRDVWDEQIAGIGTELRNLTQALERIADSLKR